MVNFIKYYLVILFFILAIAMLIAGSVAFITWDLDFLAQLSINKRLEMLRLFLAIPVPLAFIEAILS